jgi:hypothetical protein
MNFYFYFFSIAFYLYTETHSVSGSADAGTTITANDVQFNDKMKRLGRMLNLAPHHVGNSQLLMSGPGDIEGNENMACHDCLCLLN